MRARQLSYRYERGVRGQFVEVYFPKKFIFQPIIFRTLREGHDEESVKTYLKINARDLLNELAEYPNLLNPYRFSQRKRPKEPESPLIKSKKRFDMYKSLFQGWSMYEVDGVFFSRRGHAYDERVQVVRLMFRFKGRCTRIARRMGCYDVLRSIILFSMPHQGLLETEMVWDNESREQFLALHSNWPEPKKKFVRSYYKGITKEVRKWLDDIAIFVFGYLVRKFSQSVLKSKQFEEEIWVTSFFGLTVNVVRKSEQKTITAERKTEYDSETT